MLLFALTACDKVKFWEDKHSAEAAMHTYTCPMHPEVISDKPGKCPKCGMDLVLKDAPEKKEEGIKLDDLLKPTNEFVVSEQPVIKVKRENIPTTVDALGTVEYDTRQIGSISSRVAGRIEKLYVRYKYQKVSKGQRILDIYSPELLTAQQNLLFVIKNDRSNKTMIDASRQKLLLLGMPAFLAVPSFLDFTTVLCIFSFFYSFFDKQFRLFIHQVQFGNLWQFSQIIDAHVVQEVIGGHIQIGSADYFFFPIFPNQIKGLELADGAAGVDTANIIHLNPCNGLLVGYDGQGLQ